MSIIINISDSAVGTKRRVKFYGINSMSHEAKKANIVWIVEQVDANGDLLDIVDLEQSRRVITPITDENRVDNNGILILRENYPVGETGDQQYQDAWDAGNPEYSFWWTLLQADNLPNILSQAATILNNYNRFDRL